MLPLTVFWSVGQEVTNHQGYSVRDPHPHSHITHCHYPHNIPTHILIHTFTTNTHSCITHHHYYHIHTYFKPMHSDFSWSPCDYTLAYWVPELGQIPAKIIILEMPSRNELTTKSRHFISEVNLIFKILLPLFLSLNAPSDDTFTVR